MAYTAADVKNLREMTGVGMMDCKKALVACDGDMDKAIDYLREKGLSAAAMLCIGYPTGQQLARPKPPRFAVSDPVR